jgi:hypothetical protein
VHAHELFDLAFLAAAHGKRAMRPGFAIAAEAYGTAIAAQLSESLRTLGSNRATAERHLKALGISNMATLRKGLRVLGSIAKTEIQSS